MPEVVLREIPRWLVRHVCRSENHKLLGKRPKTWLSVSHGGYTPFAGTMNHDNRGFVPLDSRLPTHYRGQPIIRPTDHAPRRMATDLVAHLDNNDYRLWSEVRQPDAVTGTRLIMARCRWCSAQFPLPRFMEIVRKRHKELCDYTHNLRAVFDILHARGQCVICSRHTKIEFWGLPLCSEDCKIAWKFSEKTPGQMAIAMHKARFEGKLKESQGGIDKDGRLKESVDAPNAPPTIH